MRVTINFDNTSDWKRYEKLNENLPVETMVDFRFGNPLRHERFCFFILGLERNWTMETTLVGPGLRCLMLNSSVLAKRCEGIVARFEGNAKQVGLIPWLGQCVKLAYAGYSVKAEVPREINLNWLNRFAQGAVKLEIEVSTPVIEIELPKGFMKRSRSCNGEGAIVWSDGKYYPCFWCAIGGMKHPVYSYGELGESFEKRGQQECHLRWCPLE